MKAWVVFLVLAAIAYFSFRQYFAQPERAVSSVEYSLQTVDTKPIPRKEFFQLWNDVALNFCLESRSRLHMDPETCRSKVWENSPSCTSRVGRNAPGTIGNDALSRELGKSYVDCALPRPTCRGVEIKNEDEARQYCK